MTDHLTAAYNYLALASGTMHDVAPIVALLNTFDQAQGYVLAASSTAYGVQLKQIESMRGHVLALQERMAKLDAELSSLRETLANQWPG